MTLPASIYIHPACDHCRFLGGFHSLGKDAYTGKVSQYYDLYLCVYSHGLIARYGDNSARYFCSSYDLPSQNPAIQECWRRSRDYKRALEDKPHEQAVEFSARL